MIVYKATYFLKQEIGGFTLNSEIVLCYLKKKNT